MDPLSISVSVLTLLQLTEKFISYIKQTRDARKEQAKVLGEASSLGWLLRELQECVDEQNPRNPWLQATSGLTTPGGSLDQYKHTLEILASKIIPKHGLHRVGQVLVWKLSKEKVNGLLSQIERVKSLVLIALELDHSTLSRAIKEDLQSVHTSIADLKTDTTVNVDTTSEIKRDTRTLLDETAVRLKHELLQWVCPVDYHVQHQDFIDRHQLGTGQWFMQDMKFQEWDQSKDATLFCPGIPGAGKTIMAALVIDHLLRSQHVAVEPVTFIYCNYKRQSEQSAKHMLSNILRQIIDVQPTIPKPVQDFYSSHSTKRITPLSGEIRQALEAVSKDLRGLTIIVDALDECETRARQEFLSAVETLREQCKVRLLATSRPIPPVQFHPTFSGKPTLEVKASDEDLEKYIRSRASELHFRVMTKADLLDDLVTRTVRATGGMFLLAQLLMDSFRDKLTARDVKSALQHLPQGSDAYDVAYHGAMERILAQGEGSSRMAKKILTWLLCARRPLSTLELLHALAVEPGDTDIDEDNILGTELLLTICAGLVTIDEQSGSVRFVHYTTQEYLQRYQQTWLQNAEIEIARSCTAYLSIDGLAVGACYSRQDHKYRLKEFALLSYAAVYWGLHLNQIMETGNVGVSNDILSDALRILFDSKRVSTISQVLFMSERTNWWRSVREEGQDFSGSHWLARFGLLHLLGQVCNAGKVDIDSKDKYGRTPLSWAVKSGKAATVKLLLDTGKVDVDSKDEYGRTPLSLAAENGDEAIVKLLLDTGKVDVDSKDKDGRTPLSWAAANRKAAIVKLLLDTGEVNVASKDKDGRTPLSRSAENGDEATLKLLLDTGEVDVDSEDECGRTPLSWTAERGNEATVKLLLDTGEVNVDSKDKGGRTPLSFAAQKGGEITVKLLLDTGKVDVDSKHKYGLPID